MRSTKCKDRVRRTSPGDAATRNAGMAAHRTPLGTREFALHPADLVSAHATRIGAGRFTPWQWTSRIVDEKEKGKREPLPLSCELADLGGRRSGTRVRYTNSTPPRAVRPRSRASPSHRSPGNDSTRRPPVWRSKHPRGPRRVHRILRPMRPMKGTAKGATWLPRGSRFTATAPHPMRCPTFPG
jgi:hypothetical protein